MTDLAELRDALRNALDWLETAERIATEDGEMCDGWKAVGQTADQIAGVLVLARRLLPLHPEIEAAIRAEADHWDQYDDPRALGLRP